MQQNLLVDCFRFGMHFFCSAYRMDQTAICDVVSRRRRRRDRDSSRDAAKCTQTSHQPAKAKPSQPGTRDGEGFLSKSHTNDSWLRLTARLTTHLATREEGQKLWDLIGRRSPSPNIPTTATINDTQSCGKANNIHRFSFAIIIFLEICAPIIVLPISGRGS